jgi:hypothetical protein
VKYNIGRLRSTILGSLAVAAVLAVTARTERMPLGDIRSASRRVHRSAVNLLPQPFATIGFTERKASVGGIGINYVRGGHGPTLLLVAGYPQTGKAEVLVTQSIRLLAKLDARDRVQLVITAYETGLVSAPR